MHEVSKRLLVFFPLAFLLSWYSFLLKAAHLQAASGGINPLGPLVAAIIVAGAFDRWSGVKQLLGRYFRWMGWSSLGLVLLLPIGINAIALGINVLLGAPLPTRTQLATWPQMLPSLVFIFVFIGLGEETGWRGYALPWLQKRFSPLVAALILGAFWAAWHIPLMGVEFTGQMVPAFLVSIMPASVIMAWLFNRSNESLLTAPLLHALVNTVGGGYVFRMFHGADLTRLWWIYAILWAAVGVAVTALSRKMMTTSPPGEELKAAVAHA